MCTDHRVETTDSSFASSRKCEAKNNLLVFVFTTIQKYIEENPQRSAFKIQNVLYEQAFNCFAWVTSFFFCKHKEEQRDTLLDLRKAQVEAGSKDALKEMDTSCININITARTLFLFSNRLFYCVQLDAATFTRHRQLSCFSRSLDRIDSLHFRTDVIVMHCAEWFTIPCS